MVLNDWLKILRKGMNTAPFPGTGTQKYIKNVTDTALARATFRYKHEHEPSRIVTLSKAFL